MVRELTSACVASCTRACLQWLDSDRGCCAVDVPGLVEWNGSRGGWGEERGKRRAWLVTCFNLVQNPGNGREKSSPAMEISINKPS